MSKLSLTDITNLQNEASVVSTTATNNAATKTALENTLSRDGTSPNTMGANLDMNSNRITNLPVASSNTEPVRKAEFDAGVSTLGAGALTSLTQNGVAYASSTTAVTSTAAMTNGQVLVGQTGLAPLPKTMSGDATIAATGAITVTKTNGTALGTSAIVDTGTSGTKVPLLDGANTWSGIQTTSAVLTQASTSHGLIARGTTAQRPTAVAGAFRYNSTLAVPEFSDGTNFYPLTGLLLGMNMSSGEVINGTVTASVSASAITFALKTLAGTDPSATDPVLISFRNATAATGNYVYRTVTAALSLVISSGSTMGFTSAVAGKLWLVLFDDAGTIRMGAINTVSGTSIYPLGQIPLASSTAEGGAGGADSAQTFYTGTAVSSKAYVPLAYAAFETGVATAGTWAAVPTRLQMYGRGVPLPGIELQAQENYTGAVATGTTAVPADDTIPQITEGTQFMTQAVTPTSAAHILRIEHKGTYGTNGTGVTMGIALFQDATANALAAANQSLAGASNVYEAMLRYSMVAGTTSATTFRIRAGDASGNTTSFNGSGGTRRYGGVLTSFLLVLEIAT